MKKGRRGEVRWIVVQVESGIPVTVESCSSEAAAKRLEKSWRKEMNPEDDEVGLFEVKV